MSSEIRVRKLMNSSFSNSTLDRPSVEAVDERKTRRIDWELHHGIYPARRIYSTRWNVRQLSIIAALKWDQRHLFPEVSRLGSASPPVPRRPWFRSQLSDSEKPLEPRVLRNTLDETFDTRILYNKQARTASRSLLQFSVNCKKSMTIWLRQPHRLFWYACKSHLEWMKRPLLLLVLGSNKRSRRSSTKKWSVKPIAWSVNHSWVFL